MTKTLLISFILIIALAGFYIFQINALASEQVQVQEGNRRIEELRTGNEALELEFTENNSLEKLEGKIAELGLEKVKEVSYLRALETWVAIR